MVETPADAVWALIMWVLVVIMAAIAGLSVACLVQFVRELRRLHRPRRRTIHVYQDGREVGRA